ncbi:MAG: hypothetical protein ACO25F_04290 [Erythrobacter sp.]
MNKIALGIASLLIGASGLIAPVAVSAEGSSGEALAADWDMVAFDVKSWGAPITSWRILSNGGGSWTETVREKGTAFADYKLAWHEIDPTAANYTVLESILRQLPQPAPDAQACENFMTDAPYGTIRLTKGATTIEIAWNDGCLDDSYQAFMAVLRQADQHIQSIGKVAPVARIESPAAGE